MKLLWILLVCLMAVAVLCLLIALVCFRLAFYVPRRRPAVSAVPEGEVYAPFRERMEHWVRETAALPSEEFCITSDDGLKLYGKFYQYKDGAPIELMFHGYRGTAERDLSGGVQRCFKLGRSALIVDQRTAGKSEGNVITFGIREHEDCLRWVDFALKHFGPEAKIILTGISMGAATVLMAAGKPLPPNVIGVLADCGYNSPKDIIKKVIRQLHLPVCLCYFFVRLGARLFGRFDIEEYSPEQALQTCRVPVIFFHGESDGFVPCDMSRRNFEVCAAKKMLVTVADADHGLAYPVDPERYLRSLREFFGDEGSCKE